MTSDRVVSLLRKAYRDEIESVLSAQTTAIVVDGVRAEEIMEGLEEDIQEELHHAERIGKRLEELDAQPPSSRDFTSRQDSLQTPEDSTNVPVVGGVLQAERDAIATYQDLITAAEAADDPVTGDLAVTLLADEEAHRSKFRATRRSTEYHE